jgi:hypothetical protein
MNDVTERSEPNDKEFIQLSAADPGQQITG